jgi:DNA replication protein DnaC
MKKTNEPIDPNTPKSRLHRLGLYGLVSRWSEVATQPWIGQLLDIEEAERKRRSLDRRLRYARIGSFKAIDRFDWNWPSNVDRQAIEELFSLAFIEDCENAIFLGPNGVGKTMFMKNIAHHALVQGHTVRFTTASDMLADLAAQDSPSALARRMRRWATPMVLCIDEVTRDGCALDARTAWSSRLMNAPAGMDCGQAQIATANAQSVVLLQVVQESDDQRGVDLLEAQA